MIPEIISVLIVIFLVLLVIYVVYDGYVSAERSQNIRDRVISQKAQSLFIENASKLSKYRQVISDMNEALLTETSEDVRATILEQKMILESEVERLVQSPSVVVLESEVDTHLQGQYDELRTALEEILVEYNIAQEDYNLVFVDGGDLVVAASKYIQSYDKLTEANDKERIFAADNTKSVVSEPMIEFTVPPCSVYTFDESRCDENCRYIGMTEPTCVSPMADRYNTDAQIDKFKGSCPPYAQTKEECEARTDLGPDQLHWQCQFKEAGEPACIFKNW